MIHSDSHMTTMCRKWMLDIVQIGNCTLCFFTWLRIYYFLHRTIFDFLHKCVLVIAHSYPYSHPLCLDNIIHSYTMLCNSDIRLWLNTLNFDWWYGIFNTNQIIFSFQIFNVINESWKLLMHRFMKAFCIPIYALFESTCIAEQWKRKIFSIDQIFLFFD